MPTWTMPDGTKTTTKPKDGETFKLQSGNNVTTYMWDGMMGCWYSLNTYQVVPPSSFFNIEIKIDMADFYKCECGNKDNPVGQGHSNWCDRFKKEM